MFSNIFVHRLKMSMRSKDMTFWTWLFPILLSTLFYFCFSQLDSAQEFSVVNAAVIDDASYQKDPSFCAALQAVSSPGEGQMFNLTTVSTKEEADALLEKGAVSGYIRLEAGTPRLTVTADGLEQSIMKGFLDTYVQTSSQISYILEKDPHALSSHLMELLRENKNFTKEVPLSSSQPTSKVNYFYALLAMVCLYGSFQGLNTITYLQANLSSLGARRCLAPVGKFRMIAYDLLGGFVVHTACLFTVVAYIILVLGVDFGPKLFFTLLTCVAGSLVGVAIGAFLASISKAKEMAKTAILISFTMLCCFLAGLMVSGINYTIAQNAPALSWLNPAARITDAFYCLYYFDTYDRFFLNIGILTAMSFLLFGASALFLRRKKYESI